MPLSLQTKLIHHMFINIFDYLGAILSFTNTLLYAKTNILAWPICIIATLINLFLYSKTGIFAYAFLEIIYLSLAIYGLWHWRYGGQNKQELPISHIPINEAVLCFILLIICYNCVLYILTNHTDSTIAKLDAFAMALSLIGQWLMCRKYIETWLIWLVVDTMMVAIFYLKELPGHLILNLIYLPIALYGYYTWSKIKQKQAILTNNNTLSLSQPLNKKA